MNNILVSQLQQLQQRFGSADWSQWGVKRFVFYDRIGYPSAGTGQLQFFVNQLGATDPVTTLSKTLEETNLPQPGAIGQQYFLLFDILTDFRPVPKSRQPAAIVSDTVWTTQTITGLNDVFVDLLQQGVFTLTIQQTRYQEIPKPFKTAPPGFGVKVRGNWTHSGAATTDASFYQNSANPNDRFRLSPPQLIEPTQIFGATIDFPNGNSPALPTLDGVKPIVMAGVYFDGYLFTPAT